MSNKFFSMNKQASEALSRLKSSQKNVTVKELLELELIQDEKIQLHLDLQSKIIERVILGLDLPIIYSVDIEKGYPEIVRGRELIFVLMKFKANTLKLQSLEILSELNGLSYNGLSEQIKSSFMTYEFKMSEFDPEIDLKYIGYLALAYDQKEGKPVSSPNDILVIEQEIRDVSRRINYRTTEIPIENLVSNIIPGFTSEWGIEKKSRVIEDVLLGVPINPIWVVSLDTYDEDRFIKIITGEEVVMALSDFICNKFSLFGMKLIQSSKGVKYQDFSVQMQRKITRSTVRLLELNARVEGKILAYLRKSNAYGVNNAC